MIKKRKSRSRYFSNEIIRYLRSIIPNNKKILDLGCGFGEVLASLKPSVGVGIDISDENIKEATNRYATQEIKFVCGDVQNKILLESLESQFDFIILSNVITELHDVQAVFEAMKVVSHRRTRIIVLSYSRLWQFPLKIAETLGVKAKNPVNNWLSADVVREMLAMADLQVVRQAGFQIFPFNLSFISRLINRYIGNLPLINELTLMFGIVARVNDYPKRDRVTCSVVIPCRNEAGHIEQLARRMPDLGEDSEVIWIEGNSSDNTEEAIKDIIAKNPGKNWSFCKQQGRGKGDAVRHAFSKAKGDILMILDADVTVAPEDLPKFIKLLIENKAEFVNGCRLVYPMDEKSMRFLNLLGNRFFAALFSYLLGQRVRDTLCGTKVLWREDYEEISRNRSYFGDFDPFGDFDLLFGAARLNLKIADLPIRYGERTYGTTNISRFRDGILLFKMSAVAANKLRFI
ncbi:glycosyltransferase [bacterium]|nr:glycosyltransferase [bacterium]